jgi:LacI family transcriptional regulator
MKDIAKKAGVSKATVSRVINNTKPVSKEIREKVEAIIEETGYTPSSVARSLAKRETFIIGLIIPDLTNDFYSELVRGISDAARKHGYQVILCNTFRDHEREIDFLNLLKEKQVDAIIFTTFHVTKEQIDFFKNFNKPVVTVNREFTHKNLPVIPNIDINNYKASYEAVSYLIRTGHEKIGIIRAEKHDKTCIHRYEAYRQALEDHEMAYDPDLVVGEDFHFESGYYGMKKILEKGKVPDAMFCLSDELATGAIKAIYDFGLKCPEDISVIGFDGIPLSMRFIPSISTVSQPIFDMGSTAMETVYKMINDEPVTQEILLNYKLVIRDSTKDRR